MLSYNARTQRQQQTCNMPVLMAQNLHCTVSCSSVAYEAFEAACHMHDGNLRYLEQCKRLALVRTSPYCRDHRDSCRGEPADNSHKLHKKEQSRSSQWHSQGVSRSRCPPGLDSDKLLLYQ